MTKKIKNRIITFIFAVLLLILSIIIPTNYAVLMPGSMNKVSTNIEIENVENVDNFYTTSVLYLSRVSPLTKMALELNKAYDVYEMSAYEKSITSSDDYLMGQISKKYSYHSSLINAYQEASKVDPSILINYQINSLILYYRPSRMNDLKIGDEVIKIEDQEITKDNYLELINQSKKDNLNLTIKRDDKLIEHTVKYDFDKDKYYISFYPNIIIISSTPKFQLPGLDSTVGGPSGGLMQSINIYASLLKLNFGGLKIGGTGTINFEGAVGKIGGAPQKIHTANRYKMDIFFIANSNDIEVVNIKKNFEYYPVKTFAEAIEILRTKIKD